MIQSFPYKMRYALSTYTHIHMHISDFSVLTCSVLSYHIIQ